jgi:hypothetical protein
MLRFSQINVPALMALAVAGRAGIAYLSVFRHGRA